MVLVPAEHIYLSPHLDDAVFSCGARIHSQTSKGEHVVIWSVCAGDPPPVRFSAFAQELHGRWGIPTAQASRQRREEDLAACRVLKAEAIHGAVPDAIYRFHSDARTPLYPDRDAIFGPLHPSDSPLRDWLAEALRRTIGPDSCLYCPLTIGHHVDHQLVRQAVEVWGGPAKFYEDFPYAATPGTLEPALAGHDWQAEVYPIGEADLIAKVEAIACYASQISSFWTHRDVMRQSLTDFARHASTGAGLAERYWYYK